MRVTIPACVEHAGLHALTVDIADTCPICGAQRGVRRWQGLSYDGSRRLAVDCWANECGHIDGYPAVRREAAEQQRKAVPA